MNPPAIPQHEIDKLFSTAVELHQKGHLPQAESLYRALLSVEPNHAEALHLAGVAAHQRGDHAAAIDLIGRAIERKPQSAHYHFNCGVAQQGLSQHAAAAESYRQAVGLKPDYTGAWENLGVALQDAGDLDAARSAYAQALALDARAILAHQNLGTLLLNLGDLARAQRHFRAVLDLHPASAEAHAKHASTLLAEGRYCEGWVEYEWRHHSALVTDHYRPRLVPFAKWEGASLAGKTLLIHPEQGIGEELMFASCYAQAIEHAARVIIEADPRLVPLFARSFPGTTVIGGERWRDFAWTGTLGHVDYRIPAGSLPRYFRRRSEEFPDHDGYLRVDPAHRRAWRAALASLDKPLSIGISWTGGKDARANKARSIALAEWAPIFAAIDADFINIQYGQHDTEIAAFHERGAERLHTFATLDPVKDPDDAMALIAELDLVISIDNSTVFMAGAVGTPVWVLLPPNAEWRWRGGNARSPWFPRAELFRQDVPGVDAWRSLIERVARELTARGLAKRTLQAPCSTASIASIASPQPAARPASTSGRALLVNDTRSWYHWGCSGTSLAIHSRLRQRFDRVDSLPIQRLVNLAERPASIAEFDDDACFERFAATNADVVAQLRDADTVYINGEGTLHGVSAQTVGLLYLAYVAKRRLQRRVHLINHSCYPDDTIAVKETPAFELYRHVYRALDFVAVREPASARVLAAMGIAVTESFDCLPLFIRDHAATLQTEKTDTVVIAGSASWGASAAAQAIGELAVKLRADGLRPVVLIGADAHLAADDVQFATMLRSVAGDDCQLLNATSELEWLRTISAARLLVSGRFHHSIAAACLGTPFLLLESNTPKIAGLLERLESAAFVSIREQALSTALHERSREALADPQRHAVRPEVLERLATLAERNFGERVELE